ncbi:MAG: hypothetical protein JXR91_10490 [Deltaproteobacteria bacterium]|nr:hypothetical protein [Deltaproteobacteria bacterium]
MNKLRFTLKVIFVIFSVSVIGCSKGSSSNGDDNINTNDSNSLDSSDTSVNSSDNNDSDSSSKLDTDTTPTVVDECADLPWEVEIEPLNILVLLDRSASMIQNKIDSESYAALVQNAIDSIVKQNSNTGLTNFALNVFPSSSFCTDEYRTSTPDLYADMNIICDAPKLTGTDGKVEQPLVTFSTVDQTVDTYNEISQVLESVGQCGGTPICPTLKWARKYLNSLNLSSRTFILLATDGAPNCNHTLNPDIDSCINSETGTKTAAAPENCLDDLCAYNEAHLLAADGYRTYVIGVGEDVKQFSSVLDTLAYWGGNSDGTEEDYSDIKTSPDGTWFYPAADAESITTALESVTNKGVSCEYTVDWSTIPEYDSENDLDVSHKCSTVNILGKIFNYVSVVDTDTHSDTDTVFVDPNAGKVLMKYMPDCNSESDVELGWNWSDKAIDGYSWPQIEALDTDVSSCTTVRLCPKACEMLKVHGGERLWETITARFGCTPEVSID